MSRRQARHVIFDAEAVKARRQALGMTNEDLAREVGATLRTVQRWQDGANAPNGSQLVNLARALGVDADDLYLEKAPA